MHSKICSNQISVPLSFYNTSIKGCGCFFKLHYNITTTYSSWPERLPLTSLEREWAREGVLCRLFFSGRAATVAFLSHRGQVSVGEGLRLLTARSNVWRQQIFQCNCLNRLRYTKIISILFAFVNSYLKSLNIKSKCTDTVSLYSVYVKKSYRIFDFYNYIKLWSEPFSIFQCKDLGGNY